MIGHGVGMHESGSGVFELAGCFAMMVYFRAGID